MYPLPGRLSALAFLFGWEDHRNSANSISDDATELERLLQRDNWEGGDTGQGRGLGAPELWSWIAGLRWWQPGGWVGLAFRAPSFWVRGSDS